MKCIYCKQAISGTSEAFVTIPNPEQCGYRARTATKFVHARCYEQETIRAHEQRKVNDAALREEIAREREVEPETWPRKQCEKCHEEIRFDGAHWIHADTHEDCA